MKNIISKLIKLSSIDYHIGLTLLFRFSSIIFGGLLILMIPFKLTSPEQGYYFTFSSLIGLQVFFELGFNYVIVQVVGHEMANIYVNKKGILDGNVFNVNRVYSLVPMIKKWYGFISVFFFISVFIIGFFFFYKNGVLSIRDWLPAWSLIVLFSAINLFMSPFLAMHEGIGFVGQIATLRLIQSIVGYALLFFLLLCNVGLIAIPAISGAMVVCSTYWIMVRNKGLLFNEISLKSKLIDKISWRKEIVPFQWRIALSWLSGYFIFQLFNPMLFAHQGATEAGRVGLSLAIFSAMSTLSLSWISAKSPMMATLIADKKKEKLNYLFVSLFKRSAAINIFMSMFFLIFYFLINNYFFDFSHRIASFNILLLLSIISILNHSVLSMAIYMRAHKEEPLLWNSVVVGLISIPTIYYFSTISSYYTILSYTAIMAFVCFPWCYVIFRKYFIQNENQ